MKYNFSLYSIQEISNSTCFEELNLIDSRKKTDTQELHRWEVDIMKGVQEIDKKTKTIYESKVGHRNSPSTKYD